MMGLDFTADESLEDYSSKSLKNEIRRFSKEYLNFVDKQPDHIVPKIRTNSDHIIDSCSLIEVINKEVSKIFIKVGAEQLSLRDVQGRQSYGKKYLSKGFIKRLVKSVIDNELLTQEFPIYIKAISVKECESLPLRLSPDSLDNISSKLIPTEGVRQDKTEGSITASLNRDLIKLHSEEYEWRDQEADCADMALQPSYQLAIEFYIRVKKDSIKNYNEKVYKLLRSDDDNDEYDRIHFSLESTGIGGFFSHATKIINNAILTDVCVKPPLRERQNQTIPLSVNLGKDYFPIAHDVVLNQYFPQSNVSSPVWTHSVVLLCKNSTLSEVMEQSRRRGELLQYADLSFSDPVGWGDYCGFDLLLCGAKAALNARLRAVKYTGISAQDYIQALYERVERQFWCQAATNCVSSYPFSSFAAESILKSTILRGIDLADKDQPYGIFGASLRLVEVFLDEGAYRKAWPYLQDMENVLSRNTAWYDSFGEDVEIGFEVFSGSLLARYTVCIARYLFLFDVEAETQCDDPNQHLPDKLPWGSGDIRWHTDQERLRKQLIEQSWHALESAEKHLTVRLAKYHVLNEQSQGTFHPHYKCLSEIYLARAKIFIFFPKYAPYQSFYTPPTERIGSQTQR
ncbi:MAG: hypothetical protein V2I33_11440, partial [Kangiellaceae bacterium]|nr:hypothetical protein [Kangiellaceae bacterium]